jgi:glycosyltransferase involved in cell wall biosynthesis
MSSTPDLSVVICTLNGAPGVDCCLEGLSRQTFQGSLEVIVVDDGSSDDIAAVADRHGARLIRHTTNRGLAAARNSGVLAAAADVVAFLDDDVEPEPEWAERLLAAYGDGLLGVGGAVVPRTTGAGPLTGFLARHNPLEPLEVELAVSEALRYRIKLYIRRLWSAGREGRRAVFSLVGANMAFPRRLLIDIGLFDERFRFGAEELDLCRRLAHAYPTEGFTFEPAARVAHYFDPSLRDTFRRSRAYGRGSARMFRKWPSSRPTFYPFPVAMAALLALGLKWRFLLKLAPLVPHAMYPAGLRRALESRRPGSLVDPYVLVVQEGYGDVGFLEGLWMFRRLEPEPGEPPPVDAPPSTAPDEETEPLAHAS